MASIDNTRTDGSALAYFCGREGAIIEIGGRINKLVDEANVCIRNYNAKNCRGNLPSTGPSPTWCVPDWHKHADQRTALGASRTRRHPNDQLHHSKKFSSDNIYEKIIDGHPPDHHR